MSSKVHNFVLARSRQQVYHIELTNRVLALAPLPCVGPFVGRSGGPARLDRRRPGISRCSGRWG